MDGAARSRVEVETADGYVVLDRDPASGSELDGYQLGGAAVSLIFIDLEPGGGPGLHRHPYEEVFIVLEGQVTFTVGSEIVQANGGKVVVVRPGIPHKFVNSGLGRLRQIDIHVSPRFVTDWLEDETDTTEEAGFATRNRPGN